MRKRFVKALSGGAAYVGDQVCEVFGSLEFDFALDLRDDGFVVHSELCGAKQQHAKMMTFR